jgi:murein DD-endopeptidase MepM/ murein hydrolase activator NlpD
MILKLARPLPNGKGVVSQFFGEHPEWYKVFGMAGHNGIDYAVPIGTPVLAAHSGIIEIGNDSKGYGLYVRVVAPEYVTIYAHLSQVGVAAGTRIAAGFPLGASGNSGNSTGPHLHMGLRVNGMRNPAYLGWIDPVPFRTQE